MILRDASSTSSVAPRDERSLEFAGYAALCGRVDRAGDVFAVGAFAGAGAVPLLWQHRGAAVGVIESIGEDAVGLRIAGRVADARVAALVRSGALTGLSVGYRAIAAKQGAWRVISRVALIEVSLVAQPMQRGARVELVQGLSRWSRSGCTPAKAGALAASAHRSPGLRPSPEHG